VLVNSKGVHREVESERSWRQKSEPTNRNLIRRVRMGDDANESKAPYCTEFLNVNKEATWTESLLSYPERSEDLLGRVTSE
jgi:hypothetical protein